MEFRFNVNEIFKHPIVEINSSLIPPGLSLADKRALWDAVGKVSDVVNTIGEASATAQSLTKPITTSERLRNSDHRLYLLIDQNANNGKGVVTGMLKTGKKGLYVFDRDGHHFQVQPSCVLDFYVHESKQRMGLGKKLFEYMLEKEQVEPVKMAIDRPSDKFLGFLNKHYSLNNPVRQMNNFVVYDGFFPERKEEPSETNNTATGKSNQPANGLQSNFTSPYGRYGAPRPPCSMGQIIHNQSPLAQQTQEPVGTSLNIRQPTKIRSLPFSNRQQANSDGNQVTAQSTPNMRGTNQNFNNPQQQNTQQHPRSDYYPNAQQMQGGMIQNVETMNAQPQGNYVQAQNSQAANIQAQNNYVQPQNTLYQTQQPNLNQQQYGVQPPQYNQPPYYQNQFNSPTHQNIPPQNQSTNQFYTQSNQLQGNTYQSMPQQQQQNQQYMQLPSHQQQQYVSDKPQNIQASSQASDVQLQRKKSVQFTHTPQTMPQMNYNQPTYTQSAYDQRATQQPTQGQTVSGSHVAMQQPTTRASQTSIRPVSTNSQGNQEVGYQGQQNIQHVSNQQQSMQYPQNTLQNTPSQMYSQQPQQGTYQPQQTTHQQQYPQAAYQNQQQPQPIYQSQVPQTSQQYPTTPVQSTPQIQQQYDAKKVQGQAMNVDTNQSVPNTSANQNSYANQLPTDNNQTQAGLNQQNPQAYSAGQQQNGTMQPNTYHQNQNSQKQMNYQAAQPAMINQHQPMSVPNVNSYQSPAQNVQYSQPNIPQQIYSQAPQQVDPSTIMPPVEAAQLNKNYQYFDSNAGSMQNAVGEISKQMPGTDQMMAPNASGDNAEVANDEVEAEEEEPQVAPLLPPHPKLERPQSLSLQTSEDIEGDEEIKGELRQPQHVHTKNSFDIVEDIKKLSVGENQTAPKTPDKGDGETPKKTPSHLTEQGFFDLKFYHNKLW